MKVNNAKPRMTMIPRVIYSKRVLFSYQGVLYIKYRDAIAIKARDPDIPRTIFTSFLTSAIPHSSRDFSCSSMSFFTNSSKVSHSNLNFSFLNFSYVSLETRICGYSDLGLPLTPGIVDNMDIEDIKFLSSVMTASTDLLRGCA